MRALLAAAALLGCLTNAVASETYSVDLLGSYTQTFDVWSCGGGVQYPYPHCVPEFVTAPWAGTITVETASAGDGTFSGDDLLSLTFDTTLVQFTTDGNFSGIFSPSFAMATVQNGVVSVGLRFLLNEYTSLDVVGSNASYLFSGAHHGGTITGEALIGPGLIVPVPEPDTYALMLAGLLLVPSLMKRHRQGHQT